MERNTIETISTIALNRIFGFEPKISHTIIDNLGSAAAVFSLPRDEMAALFGPYSKYPPLITRAALDAAARELEMLQSRGYRFLSSRDGAYPEILKECEDAPLGLYVLSSSPMEELFNRRPSIAVVGTRDITPYGRQSCQLLVEAISQSPVRPTIVSGLAIGVDITAHAAAMDCGIPTVAVMATGIDSIYPAAHRRHAERIGSTPGCALVTDYPPGTSPVAVNFLRRNRIIAGMSTATVLVESRIKGGGMMTARLASSYGRDVFALPGRLGDSRSEGCNLLIHDKVAEPITDLGTACADLGLGRYERRRRADLMEEIKTRCAGRFPDRDIQGMQQLAGIIKANGGIQIDELCVQAGMPWCETSRLVSTLESEGIVDTDVLRRCSIRTHVGRGLC